MKIDLTLDIIEHQHFHTQFYSIRKQILRTTRFDEAEVERLLMTYYKFALVSGHKRMTRAQFSTYCQTLMNLELEWIDTIITFIDPSSKNSISPEDFVYLFDVWCFSNLEEKIKFCFGVSLKKIFFCRSYKKLPQVYDTSATGFLTRESLRKACKDMVHGSTPEDTEELTQVSFSMID